MGGGLLLVATKWLSGGPVVSSNMCGGMRPAVHRRENTVASLIALSYNTEVRGKGCSGYDAPVSTPSVFAKEPELSQVIGVVVGSSQRLAQQGGLCHEGYWRADRAWVSAMSASISLRSFDTA